MSFKSIVGQDRALLSLQKDIEEERVAESYLFSGPPGVGKKLAALECAKAWNCERFFPETSDNGEESFLFANEPLVPDSCGQCRSCRKIDQRTHPDLFILDFFSQAQLLDLDEDEEARQKEYKIEMVRLLKKQSYLTPAEGRVRVVVVDGAEQLSTSAANALLKVLEESPRYCRWILLAGHAERVLPTVKSRCRKIPFSLLSNQEVESVLNRVLPADQVNAGSRQIQKIAALSGGSVSIALSLWGEENLEWIELSESVFGKNTKLSPLVLAGSVLSDKKSGSGGGGGARRQAEGFLRILALAGSKYLQQDPSMDNAKKISSVLESWEELKRNVSPQLVLDALFMNLVDCG